MNWPLTKLGPLVTIQTGKLNANAADDDGIYPFFTCAREPLKINTSAFDCDAILIAGNGDLNVKHYKGKFNAYQRTYVMTVDSSEALESRYLFYFMDKYVEHLRELSIGGVIKYIKLDMLTDAKIPLPPLEEQKRIAAILDKADAIRRKRQQTIQLADDFLRSVFLDMFGGLVTSSGYKNTKKYKLIDLVDYIDYRGKTPEKSETGVPLITAKNVKDGFIDENPREFIPEENYSQWMTRGFPKQNDLLFTTEAPLGNVALLGTYKKVAIGQRLIALRSKGKITHEYLLFLMLHPFTQHLIYARSSGSTVKGIRTKELYSIELPVPDIEKQHKFSAIYWKCKKLLDNQFLNNQQKKLNFSALSQKAFRGEL